MTRWGYLRWPGGSLCGGNFKLKSQWQRQTDTGWSQVRTYYSEEQQQKKKLLENRLSTLLGLTDPGTACDPDEIRELGRVRPVQQRSKERKEEKSVWQSGQSHIWAYVASNLCWVPCYVWDLVQVTKLLWTSVLVRRMQERITVPYKSGECWMKKWM